MQIKIMKKYLLITLSSLFILTGCSINNNNPDPDPDPQIRIIHWNLVKTTGGIAGVNDSFPLETIIWTFDEVNLKLKVENNNTDDTKQDALDSGTYDYSVKTVTEVKEKKFLNITGDEFGGFTVTTNQLVIDQNDMSEGSGADGFIYTFKKTIEVVE